MTQGPTSRVMRLLAGCAALACIAAVGTTGATEVHRWVDENGVVHFSDVRPTTAPATTLELADPAPAATPSPGSCSVSSFWLIDHVSSLTTLIAQISHCHPIVGPSGASPELARGNIASSNWRADTGWKEVRIRS